MIFPLQSLRAIAALLVIGVHGSNNIIYRNFGEENVVSAWLNLWGDLGVDIFFVLSGFIIALSAQKSESVAAFLMGRVFRIYPLYILSLVVYLAIFILGQSQLGYFDLFYSIFLVFQKRGDLYYSLLGSAWTLGSEFLFYFFCALYILSSKFYSVGLAARLAIPLLALFVMPYVHPVMIEFLLGILIYFVYFKKLSFFPLLTVLLGLVSSFLLIGFDYLENFTSNEFHFFYFGLLASFVLCFSLAFDASTRLLEYLGKISYSLFLILMALTIHVFEKVWSLLGPHSFFAGFVVYKFMCIVVVSFVYYFFEKPVYSGLKSRYLLS